MNGKIETYYIGNHKDSYTNHLLNIISNHSCITVQTSVSSLLLILVSGRISCIYLIIFEIYLQSPHIFDQHTWILNKWVYFITKHNIFTYYFGLLSSFCKCFTLIRAKVVSGYQKCLKTIKLRIKDLIFF